MRMTRLLLMDGLIDVSPPMLLRDPSLYVTWYTNVCRT
jgi:hypothetical protein